MIKVSLAPSAMEFIENFLYDYDQNPQFFTEKINTLLKALADLASVKNSKKVKAIKDEVDIENLLSIILEIELMYQQLSDPDAIHMLRSIERQHTSRISKSDDDLDASIL